MSNNNIQNTILNWKIGSSLQISSSFISLVASSVLVGCILRSQDANKHSTTATPPSSSSRLHVGSCLCKKLRVKTPYQRIIFAISVSDILQSLALLIGPFALPSSLPQALWGIGNNATCIIDGLMLTCGGLWVAMYTAALSIYYYCKLYKNMTDPEFYYKIERKLHVFIILYMAITNTVAVTTNSINTGITATFCKYAATPLRCRFHDDVVCDANVNSTLILNLISCVALPFLCWVTILFCFSLILWKIVFCERIFSRQDGNGDHLKNRSTVVSGEDNVAPNNDEIPFHCQQDNGHELPSHLTSTKTRTTKDKEKLAPFYKKEMILQLTLYILAYLLTYNMQSVATFITVTFNYDIPEGMLFTILFLYPLGGIFNILIFTRPATCVVQKRLFISWPKAFWIVIVNGGTTICQLPQDEHEHNDDVVEKQPHDQLLQDGISPGSVPNSALNAESINSFESQSSVFRGSSVVSYVTPATNEKGDVDTWKIQSFMRCGRLIFSSESEGGQNSNECVL